MTRAFGYLLGLMPPCCCWLLIAGCGGKGDLPPLHPVKGRVVQGAKSVSGGLIVLHPDNPQDPQKAVVANGEVDPNGAFELGTVIGNHPRTTGVPSGTYSVTYHPPSVDQTKGGPTSPIQLQTKVTVENKAAELVLDVTKKK